MRKASEKMTVGILGSYGSFHHQAANSFFSTSTATIVPYETFLELFIAIRNKQVTHAIVAVENTISGGIAVNYTLMLHAGVHIAGELWLPVKQNLITLPGTTLEMITEIHTHPMALLQCHAFLEPLISKGVRIIETSNTALSVKHIYDTNAAHLAAIGSIAAASLYRLDIVAENIQTDVANYTRFLLLSGTTRESDQANTEQQNKATVCCTMNDSREAIPHFARLCTSDHCRITNIISLPVTSRTAPQQFVIDIVYDSHSVLENMLRVAAMHQYKVSVLGKYAHTRQQNLPALPDQDEIILCSTIVNSDL